MATLQRPRSRLDDVAPIVGSDTDIETALSELAWIEAKSMLASTQLNAELDKVRKKYAPQELVDPDAAADAKEKLADRRSKLITAITTFATSARDAILAGLGKKKTREFPLGSVAFKLQPEKLMPMGDSLDECLQATLRKYELPGTVDRWLNEYSVAPGVPLGDLLRVSFAWDATRIKDLMEKQRLTAEQLADFGLKIDREPEKVCVELKG